MVEANNITIVNTISLKIVPILVAIFFRPHFPLLTLLLSLFSCTHSTFFHFITSFFFEIKSKGGECQLALISAGAQSVTPGTGLLVVVVESPSYIV